MKTIIFYLLLISTLFARFEANPTQSCQAYNNMKHTKNTHHILLDTQKTYTVMKHHKGQYLVVIKAEQPSQRWVDDTCFSKKNKKSTTPLAKESQTKDIPKKHTQNNKQNLLALSWHNAFCETHRYKKECKRSIGSLIRSKPEETQFVLHGLWPQPRSNVYCNVDKELMSADKNRRWRDLPCLALDSKVEDALAKVMPGFASDLHKHEWIKHGSCYGTQANEYYANAVSLVNQVNTSVLGKYFSSHIGKRVTLQEVRTIANKTWGKGTGNKIELRCKSGLVTELWLYLGGQGQDLARGLQEGKSTQSRCKYGILDKAGFAR